MGRTQEALESTSALVIEAGGTCLAIRTDVSEPRSVERAFRSIRRELGPVDVLVNNVAVLGPVGPDWEVDQKSWWHTLEVNLRGPQLMARSALPDMLERGGGRIINITSSAAYNLQPHDTAYGASRVALSYWSASLDRALKPRGVRVFAYAPGFVRTSMTPRLAEDSDVRGGQGVGDLESHRLNQAEIRDRNLYRLRRGQLEP